MIKSLGRLYRDAYSGLSREVWVLCSANLVNRGGTMVLPFMSLYLTDARGQTPTQAGTALTVYGAGAMAGSYLGGWLCDRFHSIRIQIASLLLTAAAFIGLCFARAPLTIIAMLVCLSIVAEAFRPANAASVADFAPPDNRTRAFALDRMAINLGMTIAPVVGGFLILAGWSWLFLADAATCVAAAAILAIAFGRTTRKHAAAPTTNPADDRSPWRDGVFLASLVLSTVLAIMFFQLFVVLPLTLSDIYGYAPYKIGMVFATNTVVIIIFEMLLTHAVSRFNPLKIIGAGCLFTGVGLALVPLGSSFAFIALTVIVWTVGEMLMMPFMSGFVADRAGSRSRGRYMGLYMLSFSTALMIAPLTGTWVYEHLGYRTLWYSCGPIGVLLLVGFLVLSALSRRQVSSTPAAPQMPAQTASRTDLTGAIPAPPCDKATLQA